MKGFKTARRLRKAGRGSVMVISGLLVSSAVLRIVSGVALAEDNEPNPKQLPAAINPVDKLTKEAGPSMPAKSLDRTEMGSLLEALQQRETQLIERERQMEMRAKALSIADEEIAKRLVDLEEAETALRKTLSLADGAAENDLARLTTVYESMKPKDTAALFQTMEPDFAAGFLGRMRPDIAAAIMTGLPPDVAYSISVIMAGRNAKVPKT